MGTTRLLAIAEGLLVSAIWASSPVIVKMGLAHMEPLTLAGMRYFAAFLVLLPLMVRRGGLKSNPAPGYWTRLFLMGLCAYTIGNGTLFWGLQYLPATTGSFLLSLIPLPVLFLAMIWLQEMPTRRQVMGLLATVGGSAAFFSPGLSAEEPLGVGVVALGLLAFAVFSILGREVARGQRVDTLPLTALPLGFGGGLLLLLAPLLERVPTLSLTGWAIVLWLAVINTAFAGLLYNHSLQMLTALELNVLLNLAPLETALLANILLGERVTPSQVIGMVILGVAVVQWGRGGEGLRFGGDLTECDISPTPFLTCSLLIVVDRD